MDNNNQCAATGEMDMFDYPSMVICLDRKDRRSSRRGGSKKVSFYPYLERIYIESYKKYNLENSYNEDIIMAFSEEYIGRRGGKNACGGNDNACFSCIVT